MSNGSKLVKRVIFCTYPSVYSSIVLGELLRSDEIEVVAAVLSTRVLRKNYSRLYASWCQIRRSGLRYATYLFIITDLYHLLCRCVGTPSVRQRLCSNNIPVLLTKDINDEQGLAFVWSQRADVMLSAHFNQLVGPEILQMPNLSCLNIHPSLLPLYKGVDPAFYALLRKESEAGVTVHFQDTDFDNGRILQQDTLPVAADDSLLSLNAKLFLRGAGSAVQQITTLTADSIGDAQDNTGRNYDSWPDVECVRVFREGRKLLRWRELMKKLYN